MRCEGNTFTLIFPALPHCKTEVAAQLLLSLHCRREAAVHLILLLQSCTMEATLTSDAVQTGVGGCVGSSVGKLVAPGRGRVC